MCVLMGSDMDHKKAISKYQFIALLRESYNHSQHTSDSAACQLMHPSLQAALYFQTPAVLQSLCCQS